MDRRAAFRHNPVTGMECDSFIDYYEVLQVSRNARPDTIHRVYRHLAQKLHPDNVEGGDQDEFRALLEAYRVLSDPEQRAGYDIRYEREKISQHRLLDSTSCADGQEIEHRKRSAILTLLYRKRLQDFHNPHATLHEMESLVGCPREHLEFSLWFLRELGYIQRGDSGRFQITVKGVESIEQRPPVPEPGVRPMLCASVA